jgi:acetyl-CoA carboxylase carboxyltransferase component
VRASDEQQLSITNRRQEKEKEYEQARGIAARAAQELQTAREQIRRSRERLQALLRVDKHLREEADIVSLEEFAKVKQCIDDNNAIFEEYRGVAAAAELKGKTAAARASDLLRDIERISAEINSYGKILPFKSRDEEVDDDD